MVKKRSLLNSSGIFSIKALRLPKGSQRKIKKREIPPKQFSPYKNPPTRDSKMQEAPSLKRKDSKISHSHSPERTPEKKKEKYTVPIIPHFQNPNSPPQSTHPTHTLPKTP